MVGAPFNAILAWPMATPSGHAFFLNKKASSALQREEFADAVVSWFTGSPDTPDAETFEQLYVCNSSQPHLGFRSCFVREFRDGARPAAAPDDGGPVLFPSVGAVDPTTVIVSPCESVTYWRSKAVQARDTFWLKCQPYSLLEMLDYDALAPRFLQGPCINRVSKPKLITAGMHPSDHRRLLRTTPIAGLPGPGPDGPELFITLSNCGGNALLDIYRSGQFRHRTDVFYHGGDDGDL